MARTAAIRDARVVLPQAKMWSYERPTKTPNNLNRPIITAATTRYSQPTNNPANTNQPPSTDEIFRQSYNTDSITKSKEIKQRQAALAAQPQQTLPETEATPVNKQLKPKQLRALAAKKISSGTSTALKVSRFASLRVLFIGGVYVYLFFLAGWLLQILGFAVAIGLAQSVDWIPLIGGSLSDGALAVGMLIFCIGYMVALITLICMNGAVVALKGLTMDKAVIWLALTMLPILHIVSLGIWFVGGKASSEN